MLTEPIMHESIMRLLSQGDEESLECLSNLLKTMEGYFTQMQKILDKHSNNSKVRFKLQEVTDLKREVVAVSVSTAPEVPQSQADEQPLSPAAIVNSELLNTIPLPGEILSDNSPQSDISLVEQQSDSSSVSPTTENEDKENVEDQEQNKIKQSNKIKYNYKEDQWSPVNKEGKKRYDRNFLLQLQCVPMSLVKPQKLPNLDVIKDKPHVHKLGRPKLLPVLSIYRDHFWPTLVRRGVPRMKVRFPRKDENNPKAIKLIQKEAEPEAHKEQENLQNIPFQKRVPHDQDGRKNTAENTEISEERLTSSTKNISSCCIVDPKKLALTKLTDVDSIRLGPGRAMQSSSGGEIDCNSGSSPERAAAKNSEISEEDLMSSTKTESGNSNDDPNELKLTEGTIKLGELWRESKLQWTDFLGDDAKVDEFILKHKLEFTICPTKVKPTTPMAVEEIKKNLLDLLEKTDESDEIFDWIDANVSECTEPKFIRALVSAVHENAIKDASSGCELNVTKLKKRISILTRYIDHNENLELQALYAIQSLMNRLNQPKGILRLIFDILYDDDVITEESFHKWEQSDDINEVEGKRIALQSVKSFFTWLKETDCGDSDE